MKFEQKRIFISDLPETANHSEIESIFSAYGKVISINVKQRKELGPKNRSLSFAYVTLETDDRSLHRCFKDFSENDWHGEYVQLQLAKESFLDRLKREREENAQVETNHRTSPQILQDNGYDSIEEEKRNISTSNESVVYKFQDSKDCDNNVGKIRKKKKFDVENTGNGHCIENLSFNTESIEVKQKGSKKKKTSFDCSLTDSAGTSSSPKKVPEEIDYKKENDFNSDVIIKDNRHKLVGKKKLKIEETGNQPIAVIDLNKKKKNFNAAEHSLPELKRIQSVRDKVKSYIERKSLIKAALSNVDTKPNTKIKFDEDEDLTISDNNIDSREVSLIKTKLFESDEEGEDNYEPNFTIKEQFEGKKGMKLLSLQTKFNNDKRFTLGERFVDNEYIDRSDDDIDSKIQNSSINGGYEGYNETESNELDFEKKKELEILSEILSSKNASKLPYNKKGNSTLKKIVRYDPNDENCAKMELKKEENIDKKRKKKDSEMYEKKKQEEKEQPVVSKEVFYKVTNKLKEVMQQPKEGFSLLSAFGHAEEKEIKLQGEVETPKELSKSKLFTGKSPFKYDSSDDEDETSNIPSKEDLNDEKAVKNEPQRSNLNNKLGVDSFFFKADDYRFQDGLDFVKRIATKESTDFIKVRQELKSIVKSKVRNNQRKNKPFKKKLGGNAKKKKQRIKKALQR